MELFCHVFKCYGLVICLHEINHANQPLISQIIVFFYVRQFVYADTQCVNRSRNNIFVNADAPEYIALAGDAYIGNCLRRGALSQSMFFVGGQLVTDAKELLDGVTYGI